MAEEQGANRPPAGEPQEPPVPEQPPAAAPPLGGLPDTGEGLDDAASSAGAQTPGEQSEAGGGAAAPGGVTPAREDAGVAADMPIGTAGAHASETPGDGAGAAGRQADAKARAKEKVDQVRKTVADKRAQVTGGEAVPRAAAQVRTKAKDNPIPTAAIGAFVGGFLFGRLSKRG